MTADQAGTVVQKDDYYPFGLTFNHWNVPSSGGKNRYLYNQGSGEQTFQGETSNYFATERQVDLQFDMTKLRMYDYTLSRFTSVDPLADKADQETLTPYHYSLNNPVRYNNPYGDCVFGLDCPQSLKDVGEGWKAIGSSLKKTGDRIVSAIPDINVEISGTVGAQAGIKIGKIVEADLSVLSAELVNNKISYKDGDTKVTHKLAGYELTSTTAGDEIKNTGIKVTNEVGLSILGFGSAVGQEQNVTSNGSTDYKKL